MGYNHTNAGLMPLDDYVQVVAKVYGKHDKHRSIWDVWLHALHHAAGIAEQIRRKGPHLRREIADFSLWLFTTILKLNGKFGDAQSGGTSVESVIKIQNSCSDLLWHRYPMRCPGCHALRGKSDTTVQICTCMGQTVSEKPDKNARRELITHLHDYSKTIAVQRPNTIDEWQKMFEIIFARNLSSTSLAEAALHLMEELGEASDAMVRMYTYRDDTFISREPNWRQLSLESQLADVLSRLFSIASKLEDQQTNRLSIIIWERYGSEELNDFYCPFCGGSLCNCGIILVPATHPLNEFLTKLK